jgi:4-hydroxybenzoate polyprenyltransferase
MLVGQHLLGPEGGMPDRAGWLLVGAFALLFGSFYPLSQIYQISEDRRRGDHTLAVSLGVRGSLMLSLVLGSLAGAFFLAARLAGHDPSPPVLILPPVAGLLVWLGHTAVWLGRAGRWSSRDHERGMYRALAFWAVIDLTVVVSWYGQRWLR